LKAKDIYQEVLSLRRESFSEKHLLVTEAKGVLGEALMGLGEYKKAKVLLVECLQIFRETRGDDDPRTKRSIRRLIELYEATNENKKAEALKQ